jgi:UDP-glucuronate 4-epimerase
MRILVTGAAGFIGFHLARRLLGENIEVDGFDGMTPYYDVRLKEARWAELSRHSKFCGKVAMLEEGDALSAFADSRKPDAIVHLAAQAGVRYSLENPRAYVDANLVGTYNVMEVARKHGVRHFLLASTSSVYGANAAMPFHETDRTDHPLTLYAATKKATEDMAHAYAHLWKIPTTAFRFFTVYGPWGRPDMALFKFVGATLRGQPIDVYGRGEMKRDFTYIDDLVEAIARLIDKPPREGEPVGTLDSLSPAAPYRVVNIGGGQPVGLMPFIDAIERALGQPIERRLLDMQKGDVPATWAAPDLLRALTGYAPTTHVETGVRAFVDWYRGFYAA